MTYQLHTHDAPAVVEDARTQARRRIQSKRCLVCGARQLANHNVSYFCPRHLATHRWCRVCEVLRTAEEHGKDDRCRGCANERATAAYYADPDRALYRVRLRQLARRQCNRADEIFAVMRKRIFLAALVAATPGWTWARRAQTLGMNTNHIAQSYRKQCAGRVRDPDAAERERR